jgi:anthranilate/para-aminobenzoate synthase component I
LSSPTSTIFQAELELETSVAALATGFRVADPVTVLLDGAAWRGGPLLALEPATPSTMRRDPEATVGDGPLEQLARRVEERRRDGGTADTGLLALLGYDLLNPRPAAHAADDSFPDLVWVDVDRSLRQLGPGRALLTARLPARNETNGGSGRGELDRLRRRIEGAELPTRAEAAAATGPPRTSLPRDIYLERVRRVQHHIALGDIYQANLCQRFAVDVQGDRYELHRRLVGANPAPYSAFFEHAGLTLSSVSPECFMRQRDPSVLETQPIKGTRPRGATEEEDRRAAAELLRSAKDRAELVMIVDLERNDLGRICETGSVRVEQLMELRSFATVHHLVATVTGRPRAGTGVAELLRAVFPGGSITGAPKSSAMRILGELEPVRRGFFTGSLFWFGDDGSLESSILIRTLVGSGTGMTIGAGGGVVSDSDPEGEWHESNHKARALTRALGFEPEEAT